MNAKVRFGRVRRDQVIKPDLSTRSVYLPVGMPMTDHVEHMKLSFRAMLAETWLRMIRE